MRLIVVSNRLPITLTAEGVRPSSGGLVSALEGLPQGQYEHLWLGWPGKDVPQEAQAELAEKLEREHQCSPVFLPAALADAHYEGMSNSSIWPLLHYLPSMFRYETEWWAAYERTNRLFADRVLETAQDGDMVWVHDYHLMLLPAMLRQGNPSLRIGFFLHTPFPSYEVFRCHPDREELVQGLLGADLIGFHTFGYLRHFRSTVLRLLGIESEFMTIHHNGRRTELGVYPIGINARRFEQELESQPFVDKLRQFAREYAGKQVVLSVERLDYTKGILQRLDAIDIFLRDLPAERREKVKFIFVMVPSRENVEAYRKLKEQIELRVGRINGSYTTLHNAPVHFLHNAVDFTDLCALYALAQVALVTPLRDGMNLVAKEFVAAQRDPVSEPARAALEADALPVPEPGVLVLSEFAGAAEELTSALTVNPYDVPAMAQAIAQALEMPLRERRRRMRAMRHRVLAYDATAWAADILEDLAKVTPASPVAVNGNGHHGHNGNGVVHAAQERLSAALRERRPVAMFLDYDGTLREIVRDPAAAVPTPEVRALLDRLHRRASAGEVDVTIISGRTPDDLEAFLGTYAAFGMIAEHGATVRSPASPEWHNLDRDVSYNWKERVGRILRLYEQSTPGTHVEEKRTGLVWHYRRADPELGAWKARMLVEELSSVTANDPVQIRHGRKIVEISSALISKGAAVTSLLHARQHDLVLIAGDDTTDESMFRLELPAITIRVGEGQTHAQLRLADPASLRKFLNQALDGSILPAQLQPIGG